MKTFFLFFSFLWLVSMISPMTLKVEITNETKGGRPQKIEKLDLLKLEGGMQVVKSFEKAGPRLTIDSIEKPGNFPYMLQGIYQGVNYNQVIPPSVESGSNIRLKVYETKSTYQDIDLRILYVVKYVNESLQFLILYKFENRSKYTFSEKGTGIHVFIPDQTKNLSASVSVGSGLSNIRWLRMNPQKVDGKKNTFLIPYPLKPGSRIYQISYETAYDGKKRLFPINSIYPVAGSMELLLETSDMNLKIVERPKWKAEVQKKLDDQAQKLSGSLIHLPRVSGTMNLVFEGGTPSERETAGPSPEAEISIASPLTYWEKMIYSSLAFLIFTLAVLYIKKTPIWMTGFWLKRKSLLEYQIASIQNEEGLRYEKIRRKLMSKLSAIEKKLKTR